jgi:hypothetical protein
MRDDPIALRGLADQCRRLARGASAGDVADALESMSADYARRAEAAEAARRDPMGPILASRQAR